MRGFFYGDNVGLEGASGLRLDQPGRRRVGKGDKFNKAALAPLLPPQAPAAPAPAAGENGDCPTYEPPASEGAFKLGGFCYPAPGEGAVQRPAASEPGCLQPGRKKTSISLSKSLCARFEHSRALNNLF